MSRKSFWCDACATTLSITNYTQYNIQHNDTHNNSLFATLSINDNQHNEIQHKDIPKKGLFVTLSIYDT
jgi:hypothetical protein